MDWNVILPFGSSSLSFIFALLLFEQWRVRHRPYQLIWMLGMLWYGISAGSEFVGGAFGWSEGLYRIWYLVGAIYVAAWLGLGTVFLLAKTRFGYGFAFSLLLAGLFTYLTSVKYDYPQSGNAELVYFGIAVVVGIAVIVMTVRGDDRWPWLAAAVVVGGSAVAFAMVATVFLPAPGYALDPVTGIPTGDLFPGYIRLLTPFFNVTGAFALSLGAVYSAYVFMPKRRIIRYVIRTDEGASSLVMNVLIAPVAIVVNLVASLPGAVVDLIQGRLNSRVPATILIAIGGLIPAVTSGANRFGATSAFFVGEFLGVLFLFLGFLVSSEVFHDLRLPFTDRVLFARRAGL